MQKTNKNWILLVFGIIMNNSFETNAQQILPINEKSYTDSLQSILQSKQSDSIKARTSYLLSDYWRSKDTVKSKEYLIKGKAMGSKYPLVKALYPFYEGQYYFTRNTSKAAEAFMNAEKELAAFKDKEVYKFRSAAWYNYAIMKKTEKGDAFVIDIAINKAIPLSEKAGDAEKTAHYYSQLGTLLMYNGQFEKAEIYNNKAISLLESKYPNSSVLLHAYLAATSNYCYQEKKTEAKKVLDKAGEMLKGYPKSINYPNYYYNEAIYLTLTNQFDKALMSLDKGIPLAKEYNQTMLWQMLVFRKYEVFVRLKEFKKAKEVLLGLLREGPLAADVNSRKAIYDQLAKTNASMGLMEEAYKWSTAYSKTSDSLNDSKLKENINALEAKFRNAENQKMITQLEAENQKAALSAKNTRLANWLLGGAVIFLIAIAIFILYYYRNKAKLISTNAMLEGEERERTRVARDLHDGLGGMLAGVKINLSGWAENQGANINNVELDRIIGQLDNSVKELRHIARNMMPETLLKFGLETALKDLCESVMTNDIKISFQALSVKEKISTKTQLTIYRIVQELLSNAIRHAKAKNIIVQCSQNENSFYITIEDDGTGFDPTIAGRTKSMGLLNIRNRIALLKGKMNIESIIDEGTVVNVELNSSSIK
jgi:Signal transduction histidine kinase